MLLINIPYKIDFRIVTSQHILNYLDLIFDDNNNVIVLILNNVQTNIKPYTHFYCI